MASAFGNLRLFTRVEAPPAELPDVVAAAPLSLPKPLEAANRELIRPGTYRRGHHDLEPFSAAWLDELERKRYARHGDWLPAALEFGRHPGESILLINPGLGSDASRYLQHGCEVTLATTAADSPELIRRNLDRHGLAARIVPLVPSQLPFPEATFDVVVLNALYLPLEPASIDEIYRVLKAGGKVIGLFPAHFDAGFWQDLLIPYQHLLWRRPPDPTSAPKATARQLRRRFARFSGRWIGKRHLRRGELPHIFRILPLVVLERVLGRVLVLKAWKPISSANSSGASAATRCRATSTAKPCRPSSWNPNSPAPSPSRVAHYLKRNIILPHQHRLPLFPVLHIDLIHLRRRSRIRSSTIAPADELEVLNHHAQLISLRARLVLPRVIFQPPLDKQRLALGAILRNHLGLFSKRRAIYKTSLFPILPLRRAILSIHRQPKFNHFIPRRHRPKLRIARHIAHQQHLIETWHDHSYGVR